MPNLSRLSQFAAFSPLKGYETLILEQQRLKTRKLDLSPEQLADLDATLQILQPETIVLVKYYNLDCYEYLTDYFLKVDPVKRTFHLKTTVIPLENIAQLTICNK